MAARKTSKSKATSKENTVEGITFEVMEELPTSKRGSRRSWFTEVAEQIREQNPQTADGENAWVKVREYDKIGACRSAASGSLKDSFPDFKFSTRKTEDDGGHLFAQLQG